MSYHPGEDHTIDKPAQYDFWRDYQAPFWPGKHLGWQDLHPITLETRTHSLFGPSDDPNGFTEGGTDYRWGREGYWHYRRIRSHQLMADGGPDISLVNWPMNDYWLAPIVDVSPDEERAAREAAGQLSLSLLFWLQTEAPHPDGILQGYPGLKLRPDVVGTETVWQRVSMFESRAGSKQSSPCAKNTSPALYDLLPRNSATRSVSAAIG